jgi:hypothetical protein
MIITYAGPAGRQVVMADANPGIGGLGAATALTLEEFRGRPAPGPRGMRSPAAGRGPDPVSWRQGRLPPNLGPPPPRLDWRTYRS